MANKNIYVSESDLPIFEEAQKLAGGNLSWAITQALHRYVTEAKAKTDSFDEVIVKVNQDGFFAKKRFQGRLLTQVRLKVEGEDGNRVVTYAVYRTPKGKWAVRIKNVPSWWYSPSELANQSWRQQYWEEGPDFWKTQDRANQDYEYRLDVYDTEEEMQAHIPERVYTAVSRALTSGGGDVEDLDL